MNAKKLKENYTNSDHKLIHNLKFMQWSKMKERMM